MSEPASRPPWPVVALSLAVVVGLGAWMMSHTYNDHDPGLCGGKYARARTAADSAAVDRFVPDSEAGRVQPRPCRLLRGPTPEEYAHADSLLVRAIAAAGGDSALAHLTALEWQGIATPGDSADGATGTWRIAPPDSEDVTIWHPADSAATARRVVVTPASVWGESHGDSVVLTTVERNAERQLVYEYGLLRLVSLREPGTLFWPLAADSSGRPGLLVRTAGHLDTALYFGPDDRVALIRTTAIPSPGAPPSTTTITLGGTMEVAGVRWFKEIQIVRDGSKELDLTITSARPASSPAPHQ